MEARMTIKTRKEILTHIKDRYNKASWDDKRKILDELVLTTNYRRKYAIHLLSSNNQNTFSNHINKNKIKPKKYGKELNDALIKIWSCANQICSKRLVPFLPDLVNSLERFGHIDLSPGVRDLIL